MKKILFITCLSSICFGVPMPMPSSMPSFEGNQKIGVQNTILTQSTEQPYQSWTLKKN